MRSDTSMQPHTTPLHAKKSCKSGLHLQITERNLPHCHPSSSEKNSPFSLSEEIPSTPPKATATLESRQTATSSYGLCWTRVCTSSLRSTQLHIETLKELLLRPSSTTLLIFSSKTDTACSAPAQDHVQSHNASLLSKLHFGEKEIQSKRCGSRQWFSTLLNGTQQLQSVSLRSVSVLDSFPSPCCHGRCFYFLKCQCLAPSLDASGACCPLGDKK